MELGVVCIDKHESGSATVAQGRLAGGGCAKAGIDKNVVLFQGGDLLI